MNYIILLTSYLFIRLIIPLTEKFYINSSFVKENYKGELIPNSMGIIYIFNTLLAGLLLLITAPQTKYFEILLFMLGILTMGFIGLIDDFLGGNDAKGFKGHIKMLINRELTTGGLKAIFGGVISLLISILIAKDLLDFFINILLLSLFANFINLLDLRPGRALKAFLIFSIPSLIFVDGIVKMILLSSIGASLAYIPYDIKGKSMLGDIGSNSLGIILGITAINFQLNIKIILVIFLILANLYSEKHSISSLIHGNKILSFLDELGRSRGNG